MTVRPVERLDGDEGFAEVFFDDVFVARRRRARRAEPGLERRDGDDRLRARAHAALARAGSSRPRSGSSTCYHDAAATRSRRCATALVAAWIDAEAYRWQTFWTVTRIVEGEPPGAESSLVKLFWSELDVRLHELALELLGPTTPSSSTASSRRG